jgi:hypothetical protein
MPEGRTRQRVTVELTSTSAAPLIFRDTIPSQRDLIVGSCTYDINTPAEQRRENNLYPVGGTRFSTEDRRG